MGERGGEAETKYNRADGDFVGAREYLGVAC